MTDFEEDKVSMHFAKNSQKKGKVTWRKLHLLLPISVCHWIHSNRFVGGMTFQIQSFCNEVKCTSGIHLITPIQIRVLKRNDMKEHV